MMLCVPSRVGVPEYHQLKKDIDEKVGNINGQFGQPGWTPILYLYRSVPFEQLVAMYQLADVAFITPLRDGMNLVAKEYLACHTDEKGVLILSETAGAAEELGEALIVNPHDTEDMVSSLTRALNMKPSEQKQHNRVMLKRLRRYNNDRWWMDFLNELDRTKQNQKGLVTVRFQAKQYAKMTQQYREAKERLFLLDYDGTLAPYLPSDQDAKPDRELIRLLKKLSADPKNKIVILSSRGHTVLESWFGSHNMGMVAEHGARFRDAGDTDWEVLVDPAMEDWKSQTIPLLEVFVDRTPGSQLEEKPESLSWHYHQAEPELGSLRAKELKDSLSDFIANKPLHTLQGKKVVEIKSSHISKGQAVQHFLNKKKKGAFLLAVGDDITDEDVFQILPKPSWSIKIGRSVHSSANYYLRGPEDIRELLRVLTTVKST